MGSFSNSLHQAVLATILYSDLFDFPLTKEEIWKYLITKRRITPEDFAQELAELSKQQIILRSGYYCLPGRTKIIQDRKKNKLQIQKKMRIAKHAAYYLSFIPTIKLIGISGGLSIGNVSKDDDIDFFIITQKNTLFFTRFFVLFLLEVMKLRRKHGEVRPANVVCANYFLDETKLRLGRDKGDIYTAHELAQLQLLFERNGTYKKFLDHNSWAKYLLPHAFHETPKPIGSSWETNYYSLRLFSFLLRIGPAENILRTVQLFFINRHRTTEIVTKRTLAFHPINYRTKTLQHLKTRMTELGLLTNF